MGNVLESEIKPTHKMGVYEKYMKRPLDFILSLCAIIVLSPVLLLVAILVKIKLGSPVIFKQLRPGLHGKIFSMYKFRTMTDEKDENGNLLPDEKRLTGLGKILRSMSLDELPELFCILNGSMSCVGPRPQLIRDMVFMTDEQRRRHIVTPGLTGYAQVSGRNNITWEQKIEYDLQYIYGGITLIGDAKIILQTIGKVLMRSDTVREGTVSDVDFGDWLLMCEKISKEEYDQKQTEAEKILEMVKGKEKNTKAYVSHK